VELLVNRKVASLKLGFGGDTYSYSIDLGYPPPPPPTTMFELDPTTRDEEPVMLTQHLSDTDSMLASIADPQRAPEMLAVREAVRGWRFYDHFRTDSDSPARAAQIGTFTPVLHHDGSNLAAALQTILEIRSDEPLATTLKDAFPGSRLSVQVQNGRFELQLQQQGLLRSLSSAELSDGRLRYLLWADALLTPRPPELMVLNQPETSLYPDLLPPLARLMSIT
jgi:predicted ATPase